MNSQAQHSEVRRYGLPGAQEPAQTLAIPSAALAAVFCAVSVSRSSIYACQACNTPGRPRAIAAASSGSEQLEYAHGDSEGNSPSEIHLAGDFPQEWRCRLHADMVCRAERETLRDDAE